MKYVSQSGRKRSGSRRLSSARCSWRPDIVSNEFITWTPAKLLRLRNGERVFRPSFTGCTLGVSWPRS